MPADEVTDNRPEAGLPIFAVIPVDESTEKGVAFSPPMVTEVTPVKLIPFIFMVVPVPPELGVTELIFGPLCVNPSNEAEPIGVVTATFPVAPVAATTAVILVAVTTLNEVAATPPNKTAVAPVKLVPVMVTTVDF